MNLKRSELQRIEAELGDGRVICERCGATLDTYSDACTAALDDPCPGFQAIETAATGRPYTFGGKA